MSEGECFMYKGIILKVKKQYAVVLADNHLYYKIHIKGNLTVGQKIWFLDEDLYEDASKKVSIKRISATVATFAALIAFIFIFPNLGGELDYNVVSVDINPSIEIHVNDDDVVKDIIPLNDDAKDLINDDMLEENILEVLDDILHEAEIREYLSQEDNYILISTAERNDSHLNEKVEAYLNESLELEEDVTIYYVVSDMKTANQAQSKGVSLGKMALSQITEDPEVQTQPVRETLMNNEKVKETVPSVVKDNKGHQSFEDAIDSLISIESPSEEIVEFLGSEDILAYLNDGTLPENYKELTKSANAFLKTYTNQLQQDNNGLIAGINEILDYLYQIEGNDQVDAFLDNLSVLETLSQQELTQLKQDITTLWNSIKQNYKELWVPGQSDEKPGNSDDTPGKSDDTPGQSEDKKPDNAGNKNTSTVDEDLLNSLLAVIDNLRLIPSGDVEPIDEFLTYFDSFDLKTLDVSTAISLKKDALTLWQDHRKDYKELWQEDEEESDDEELDESEDPTEEENDEADKADLINSIITFKQKLIDLDSDDESVLQLIDSVDGLIENPTTDLEALLETLKSTWKDNRSNGNNKN